MLHGCVEIFLDSWTFGSLRTLLEYIDSGWWQPLNALNVHPGCLGEMVKLDKEFSTGLKPPTIGFICSGSHETCNLFGTE